MITAIPAIGDAELARVLVGSGTDLAAWLATSGGLPQPHARSVVAEAGGVPVAQLAGLTCAELGGRMYQRRMLAAGGVRLRAAAGLADVVVCVQTAAGETCRDAPAEVARAAKKPSKLDLIRAAIAQVDDDQSLVQLEVQVGGQP